MGNPLGLILGGAGALIGAIGKGSLARKQKKLANQIVLNDPTYEINPYAKQGLAEAILRRGGRMPGATELTDQIYGNQADTIASVENNSTDAATALSVAAGLQGNTNNALADLQLKEAQYEVEANDAVERARQGLITEGDKVYSDKIRKYSEAKAAKDALIGSSIQNKYNMWSDIGNFGIMAGMGMFGGGKKKTA
jgi:hypothetical protein